MFFFGRRETLEIRWETLEIRREILEKEFMIFFRNKGMVDQD